MYLCTKRHLEHQTFGQLPQNDNKQIATTNFKTTVQSHNTPTTLIHTL